MPRIKFFKSDKNEMSHIFMTFADTAEGEVCAAPYHHKLPLTSVSLALVSV